MTSAELPSLCPVVWSASFCQLPSVNDNTECLGVHLFCRFRMTLTCTKHVEKSPVMADNCPVTVRHELKVSVTEVSHRINRCLSLKSHIESASLCHILKSHIESTGLCHTLKSYIESTSLCHTLKSHIESTSLCH